MPSIHVAMTPRDTAPARVQIVVDQIRATSTIAQALASGYERVICVAEVGEAHTLRADGVVLGGERHGVLIDGFDLGNSPAEYVRRRGHTLVLTTTNGTRAILQAVAEADVVLVGSLSCLAAVTHAALEAAGGGDVAVRCAGARGEVALDDLYVAGRFVAGLAGGRFVTDGARVAAAVVRSYASPLEAMADSQSARDLRGTGHEADVGRCADVDHLTVAPRVFEVLPGQVVLGA